MVKKSKRGTRYTATQKAKILAAAKNEGLSGAQVAKRFGVSTLTFYRWRGPVRSDALKRAGKKRGPGRPKGTKGRSAGAAEKGNGRIAEGALRREVQAQVRKLLPTIIREEVAAYLREAFGR